MKIPLQKTFDFVVHNVIRQGRKSTAAGVCAYRGDNGTRCAAGWLIPDEKYDRRCEGNPIFGPDYEVYRAGCIIEAEGHDLLLVAALQEAHDHSFSGDFVREFASRCREVAREFSLSTDALEAALAEQAHGASTQVAQRRRVGGEYADSTSRDL